MAAIGFIGLGAMGIGMASRLLDGGHEVVVHNRTRERERELVTRGARPAASPREVAESCDLVLSCLLDDEAVRQVYRELAEVARPGQVFVEHGTFSPALAREIAQSLAARGGTFLDAPVSGGPEGAASGSLTIMIGGPDSSAVRDVLGAYAGKVVHAGTHGAGLELKLVNQLLVSCHAAAAAEAEGLLSRMQINPEVASSVLGASWASSTMLDRLLERRKANESGPSGATVGGLAGPQQLVRDLLAAHDLKPSVSLAALDLFDEARTHGRGSCDLTELLAPPC
jgi:3-hydroxyisobutyrate dehydrogenase-like beta-hydroxyacid dehydrogenase